MQQGCKNEFSLLSMMDDFGRVFFRNGDVYRAIRKDREEDCLSLLKSELFKELSEKGLIPKTTISKLKIENFDLIIAHERLLEILQHEWSFDMLKDASLAVLEINKICYRHGYELKDAHTLNILFRGSQPVLVDIGSISKKTALDSRDWIAYEEFLGSFAVPLFFWERKKNYIVRKLLESNFHRMVTIPGQTLAQSGLMDLLFEPPRGYRFSIKRRLVAATKKKFNYGFAIASKVQSIAKRIIKRNDKMSAHYNFDERNTSLEKYFPISEIQSKIMSAVAPVQESTWAGYHSKHYTNNDLIQYSPRFFRIVEFIKSKNQEIRTVIDLAGNEGFFCQLLNDKLAFERIILADYDENAVNRAYLNFKKTGQKNAYTVLLNFMFTPNLKGTAERFKSDLVLALAVTHHLLISENFSIGAIFERLRLFSNKYVMVEFMPLGLWAKGDSDFPELPVYYNVEWFRKEFLNYFSLIIEEKLEDNRILFFGFSDNS